MDETVEGGRQACERGAEPADAGRGQRLEELAGLADRVAHDLNNVLQAIHGMASVLKARFAQDPAAAPGLDIILKASDRGRDLVRGLADRARESAGTRSPETRKGQGGAGPGDGKSLAILLIDDDELIRDSFPELMAILGHRVVATASEGAEGIRLVEEGLDVELVFLDQNMPGLGGLETLTRLRALRPGLPVVFCTGQLDDASKNLLNAASRVWILMKPYSLRDLRPILREAAQGG